MNATFSIVIPCYNDSRFLHRSVGSAFAQRTSADGAVLLEVLLVDDGSTDETARVCEQFTNEYLDVFRYLYKTNGGVSTARNTGIENVRGEYLIFLDADDELSPDALENYAKFIEPDTNWLIGGSRWERDGRVRERNVTLPASAEQCFVDYLEKKLHLGNISNMCWRRSLFDDFRFDPTLPVSEDVALFAVLLTRETPVIVPEPTALAHRREDSLRTRTSWAGHVESVVVDVIFQHPLLAPSYQKFLSRYLAQRGRSIMKRAYREGRYDEVVTWYPFMLRHNPLLVGNLKMLYRYTRSRYECARIAS
ncbi:MAG: glycosyltransferase family A protein [Proteobacteria bacterium]|nr:glycosyltransferase family A protein [Pseudomonadota bacterium]